jgi:multidrug efflux pump subunit AcrA (membrane-fusion protein)
MRLTTFYTVTIIALIFLTLQGWLVHQKLFASDSISVLQATIVGKTADIRPSQAATITQLFVRENDKVAADAQLLTLRGQKSTITLTAPIAGEVRNLTITRQSSVQPNDTLMQIVDTSPASLRVEAIIGLDPEDLPKIRQGLLATVQAEFLNVGKPVQAVVTAVDPVYNAYNKSVNVTLEFRSPPVLSDDFVMGLPVTLKLK